MKENEKEREVKPVVITDTETGEVFTLEYSRASVKIAENMGYSLDALKERPINTIETLWYCAFLKNHPRINKQRAEQLLDGIGGVLNVPEALLLRLVELLEVPFKTLSEGDGAKNPRVTVEL